MRQLIIISFVAAGCGCIVALAWVAKTILEAA